MPERKADESIGAALGRVRWDLKRRRIQASLLEPMQRFFRDFPWEGRPAASNAQDATEDEEPEDQIEP